MKRESIAWYFWNEELNLVGKILFGWWMCPLLFVLDMCIRDDA